MRPAWIFSLLALGAPVSAAAQPAPEPPLVRQVPATARAAALGDAWVAGRDAEVIFYNPAQLVGARSEFGVSVFRTRTGTLVSAASAYAAGRMSLTLGWGAQVLAFDAPAGAPYPYSPGVLLSRGASDGQSTLLTFGGALVYRSFRIGGAAKYAADRSTTPAGVLPAASINQHGWLADVGVARDVLGGVASFAVQDIGRTSSVPPTGLAPHRRYVGGYSISRQAGPLDLAMFGQLGGRKDWVAPAGGIEIGYSWIDGYTVAVRAGARRPELQEERPFSFGAALTADRLTVEYAVQFFEGGRTTHGVTVRWR